MRLPRFTFSANLVRLVIPLLVIAVALASASCDSRTPAGTNGENTEPLVLRRGLGGQPGSLDPQRGAAPSQNGERVPVRHSTSGRRGAT